MLSTLRRRLEFSLFCSVQNTPPTAPSVAMNPLCDLLWARSKGLDSHTYLQFREILGMFIHRYPAWTPVLAKELTTGASVASGGKAGLQESKPEQIQNSVLWMVPHEYIPARTTEGAGGVQSVCLEAVTSNVTVIPELLCKLTFLLDLHGITHQTFLLMSPQTTEKHLAGAWSSHGIVVQYRLQTIGLILLQAIKQTKSRQLFSENKQNQTILLWTFNFILVFKFNWFRMKNPPS